MSAAGVGMYDAREAWAAAPIGRPASHQSGGATMSLSDEAREGLIEIATEMQAAMVEDWRAGRWEPDADRRDTDRRDACPTGIATGEDTCPTGRRAACS